jgi:branched-chain amino acid transport system substrate-binding protein
MKRKNNPKFYWIGGIILVLVIIGLIIGFSGNVKDEDVIKVGFVGPFSGDGTIFGEPINLVVDIALKDINNPNLKIIYGDGVCSSREALNEGKRLIEINNVDIILGGVCSSETLGLAPYVNEKQIILLSPTSASPIISNSGEYVFRTFPSEDIAGIQVAKKVMEDGFTKIAVLQDNTEYSVESLRPFINTINELGGNIVIQESFSPSESDFRTILTKVANTDYDALFIMIENPSTLKSLLKDMITLDKFNNKPIYGADVIISGDVLDIYGDFLEGGIYSKPYIDLENEKVKDLLNRFEKEYGSIPFPELYIISTYDSVQIINKITAECGKDKQCMKSTLETSSFVGLLGTIKFDENGDVKYDYKLYQIKNKTSVAIS